jgi:hypothetical protein
MSSSLPFQQSGAGGAVTSAELLEHLNELLSNIQAAAVRVHLLSLCVGTGEHDRKIFTEAAQDFCALTKQIGEVQSELAAEAEHVRSHTGP